MSYLSKMCKYSVALMVILSLISMIGCKKAKEVIEKPSEGPAGWTLQFSDDFERAEIGKDWTILDGDWSIKNGSLTSTSEWAGEIMCSKKFPGAHRLEFDAKSDKPCDLTGIICAGDTGFSTGYFVGFGSEENAYSKLLIEGAEIKVWDAVITPGKVHHQVVQKEGNTITHILDGKTVMTYEHDKPLKGEGHQKIGLYVFFTGQVDNVKVYTKKEE